MSWVPIGERWGGQDHCFFCNGKTHGSDFCEHYCSQRYQWEVVDPPKTDKPRYDHGCESCVWLGQHQGLDLWVCPSHDFPRLSSIIARYGDDGDAYLSTHPPSAFAGEASKHVASYTKNPGRSWYSVALCRIAELHLLDPKVVDPGPIVNP